jgi:hypothetical protein
MPNATGDPAGGLQESVGPSNIEEGQRMTKASGDDRNLAPVNPIHAYSGQDCFFLALVMILSSSLYISRLGFYWDDWFLLKIFHFSRDQSLIVLVRSLVEGIPDIVARPVQAVHLAVLYQLFGMKPLGYHLANTATFCAGICVFYLALREFTGRLTSLAIAIVYGLLPHYSTDRFWYATFNANISMFFYFLSLYCNMRELSVGKRSLWPLKAVASASLVLSCLAYEVFMPLFLLNPILFAFRRRQLEVSGKALPWSRSISALTYLINPVLLALIYIFKGRTTSRAPGGYGLWLLGDAVKSALDLNFYVYGVNLPHILLTISQKYWSWPSFLITIVVVGLIAWYLIQAARISGEQLPRTWILAVLVVAGAVFSGLSYAYLYSFFQVNTGVNNRAIVAAAVPVAVSWVALVALLSRALTRRNTTTHVFCVVVALLCGSGCLINNVVSSFWIGASQIRQQMLTDMKEHFSPPRGSTVLLTGFCAWNGPGIVFEATWDVKGALALLYQDETMKGEPVWPWMMASEAGIRSGRDTAGRTTTYSYSSLYLYDVRSKQGVRVPDLGTASHYIKQSHQDDIDSQGCLTRGFGSGLPIW